MMEGSESGSGSVPLINGSGSAFRRPKNIRILRIRIRNTAKFRHRRLPCSSTFRSSSSDSDPNQIWSGSVPHPDPGRQQLPTTKNVMKFHVYKLYKWCSLSNAEGLEVIHGDQFFDHKIWVFYFDRTLLSFFVLKTWIRILDPNRASQEKLQPHSMIMDSYPHSMIMDSYTA